MKGVILAGGTGSRLFPLTKVTNKHLLPVYDQPMIYYPLKLLLEAGISDILIVSGFEHAGDFLKLLGSGKEFGARFTYEIQDEAGGIAQALGLAEDFVDDSKFVTVLGDNVFEDFIGDDVAAFEDSDAKAMVFLKQVPDPHRFGVAHLDGDRVERIVEKPKSPKSDWAVTGLYFYSPNVCDVVRTLKPSGRGELEITDVNNWYIEKGTMIARKLEGFWSDAGTFESLFRATSLVHGVRMR